MPLPVLFRDKGMTADAELPIRAPVHPKFSTAGACGRPMEDTARPWQHQQGAVRLCGSGFIRPTHEAAWGARAQWDVGFLRRNLP